MVHRAIKYRLYPTAEQKTMFAKTFGCCRKVYNLMLSDKIDCYKKTKSFGKQTPAMYKKEFPFLKEVDSLALANVQMNLQAAFRNCFTGTNPRSTAAGLIRPTIRRGLLRCQAGRSGSRRSVK